MPSSQFSATDLHQLERQLQSWRRSRRGQRRLPGEVWEAAVVLGRTHGLSRVARALRLDYHKLQRLSQDRARVAVGPSASACPPGFVEMRYASLGAEPGTCRVELGNGQGATMTVHLPNDTRAVLRLVEAFWRQS
jgi:hypothetical protein